MSFALSSAFRPRDVPSLLTRITLGLLLAVAVTAATVCLSVSTAHAVASSSYVVSTSGSDGNPGTVNRPFRTIGKGLSAVRPGDTLLVRGGMYDERLTSPRIVAGSASASISVRNYPGERPVLRGLLWLKNPSYWTISGLNVTWSGANDSSQHMVKLTGGTGWTFRGAEVWGAHSYAAILVAGRASNWRITGNYVHDTYKSNGTNQDHLIYVNADGTGGVVERNRLANSVNGRAVKIGPPSAGAGHVNNVTIRYNTMYNNLGPSNVQLAWGSSNNLIYGNIMVKPAAGRSAVTAYQLSGTGNKVYGNAIWQAVRAGDTGVRGLLVGANVILAPQFRQPAAGDFSTANPAAAGYGYLAR